MRNVSGFVVAIFAMAGCSDGSQMSTASDDPTPKLWPSEEIAWNKDPTLEGVRSVNLWGNPEAGEEHAMLRVFPAGFAPAKHSHPSTESVVVVSGYIVVEHEGGDETVLGPGSYSEIPAGMPHAVRCATDQECKFVLRAPGMFTIDFVE